MSTPSPILEIFNESEVHLPFTQSDAEALLALIAYGEEAEFEMVELAYVDEEEIVRVNSEHLDRDYITDIISFRYDDGQEKELKTGIEGTLYCCAPRIQEQADEFDQPVKTEFLRIFTHGLLHLIGYEDGTVAEKTIMTELENKYLASFEANK